MYDLTDFQSYQDYFTTIAQKHKSINGNYSFGDQDVMNNEVRTWAGTKLWLWPYGEVKTEENSNDNNLDRVSGSLFIGGAAGSTKFADEYSYFLRCEQIVKDIRNKVLFDLNAGTVLTRLSGWTRQQVEINMSTKLIGCELRFFYNDPTGFEYDPNKWN